MAKKPNSSSRKSPAFSDTARALLLEMQKDPRRIEYMTRVLGGTFGDDDVRRLDEAYLELARLGLVEPAGITISFFGKPKQLHRLTEDGKEMKVAA